jgi:GTPase
VTTPNPVLPNGHTTRSGFVAIVGRPNAGKSTLLNRLIGQKVAITSLVAQTTRYRIRGVLHHALGQAVFLDTPGFSKPQDSLTHYLVEQAHAGLNEADVVLWVVDMTEPPGTGDEWMAEQINRTGKPAIVVCNKRDQLKTKTAQAAAHRQAYAALLPQAKAVFSVSARTGKQTQDLITALMPLLPFGPLYYPETDVTDQRIRELAAELIREQVLRQMRDELPHSVAVLIEQFDETDPDCVRIYASLVVNQPSQKLLVVGAGGHQIKQIGQEARKAIEQLLEQKVFLGLEVVVRKNWRRDAKFIELMHGPTKG